jgi:hypothetical protein
MAEENKPKFCCPECGAIVQKEIYDDSILYICIDIECGYPALEDEAKKCGGTLEVILKQ